MARWLALIAITQQVACGGKTTTTATLADPAPVASVTISPSSAQLSVGGSVQFVVTVQNASNPAVTWQVNGIPGGNSAVGTITPAGAATASYLAPANVAATAAFTVSAVLQADGVTNGSATVTISPPPPPQISISPSDANVVEGTSLQFSATVQNAPQAVIWEVNGLPSGNAIIGTIITSPSSLTAFYNAPAQVPNPPVVTLTALLRADLSISGSTTITIVPPPVSISISPSTANLAVSQNLQLTATVQNSSMPVEWGLAGQSGNVGTIVATGPYTASFTAPANIPIGPGPFTVNITATLQGNSSVYGSAGVTIIPAGSFTGVYSWKNDASLTGQDPDETTLTPANVETQFGKLYGCPVDGQIYAQPLYASNVAIPNQGTFDVVYVATENDSVYAFNAMSSSCQIFWQASFINPVAGVTTVPGIDITGQTDIVPVIGITGTPAIDPATATLYVVAKTKENGAYVQRLHALDLTTGAEKFGGPSVIRASANGDGDGSSSNIVPFDPLTENQRSALQLAGGNVYVAFDSYDDTDPFHGWLLAYNAGDLTKPALVLNSTPNGSHGGIGESGAAPASDGNGYIFVATSDGTRDTNSNYGETLLKLDANTAASNFDVVTTFTPWNEAVLNSTHEYFGSTGVLLLPNNAGSAAHPHLAIAGSEAGIIYLVDRDNLGGFTVGGPDNVPQELSLGASVFGTPSYWASNNSVYLAPAGESLKAFALTGGSLSSPSCPVSPALCSTDTFPFFGASPVISWDGSTAESGIVWALDTSGYTGAGGTSSPAILHAYDATNLANEIFASPASGTGAAGLAVKFAVPTVANGMVFVGTQNELSVFGLVP